MRRRVCCVAACGWLLIGSGCNLLDTENTENVPGRGAKAFDPYQGVISGAARLSLQSFDGCAILGDGEPVAGNRAPVPYPAQCADPRAANPRAALVTPTAKLQLLAGTKYFLNELTVEDQLVNVHTDPTNFTAVINWFETSSVFRGLDWNGVTTNIDRWRGNPNFWTREVLFGNAAWMAQSDDTFLLEFVDTGGIVRLTAPVYSRSDFLTEAPTAGHTQFSWRMEQVGPPKFPGDTTPHPVSGSVVFRTTARMDLAQSTNPFKEFEIPRELTGEFAIRLTWSQLPNAPLYFPVSIVDPATLPASCFSTSDESPTPCSFGLDSDISFGRPANGSTYQPGEHFDVMLSVQDSTGNRLHPVDSFPSYGAFQTGNSNGLLYFTPAQANLLDQDSESAFQIAGPIDKLYPRRTSLLEPSAFYLYDAQPASLADTLASTGLVPGLSPVPWPTRVSVTLPANAEPGTYLAMLKSNRYFFGERTSRISVTPFPVGSQATSYPGRVGNCQICHRGVLSLSNIRHGMSVDHLEACKACHIADNATTRDLHEIHMQSPKYPFPKNDCTACHLTLESATRPSYDVCSSCHPSPHGDNYFALSFSLFDNPTRIGNCAQACHALTPPKSHILPAN